VLAGGGAKGAFQAGAMKAIYRYLEEHDMLEQVAVISGTSIGAWNALFWLSDLVRPVDDWNNESSHQRWWSSLKIKKIIAPSWYVPLFRNCFLTVTPWKRVYDNIFGEGTTINKIKENGIRFYLTRSNVEKGELVCATNNPDSTKLPGVEYDFLNPQSGDFVRKLREAVFASMDLPPLFPYIKLKDKNQNYLYFEDGGVIDNLPISFAALEGCDLIFVLPLNSDFEKEANLKSVFARLFRVMDVRQGVLERKSLRDLYLYNELAELRDYAKALEEKVDNHPEIPVDSHLADALGRKHKKISIFAVCPDRDFVLSTINTQEFWKQKEAKKVFDIMCQTTWKILEKIESVEKDEIPGELFKKLQLFSVNKCGEYESKTDF